VAYGDGSGLPKKWMHKDFGKPKVVTIQLDSSQQRPAEHWQNAATMQSSCAG
jgi:hypothetical protein